MITHCKVDAAAAGQTRASSAMLVLIGGYSVSSSAFYHLIDAKTKMAPLISLVFRRNDIAKDFRKARKDPVK